MKKILIVEDDQKIGMALVIRLKASGYNPSVSFIDEKFNRMTDLSYARERSAANKPLEG